MINMLVEVLALISDRNFHQSIDPLNKLVLLSKKLSDTRPTILLYQMFGSLLMNIGYFKESFRLFEIARDLAHEAQNLAQELVCYEWLGKVKQEQNEFMIAKTAYKKMLQMAWLCNISDYEY